MNLLHLYFAYIVQHIEHFGMTPNYLTNVTLRNIITTKKKQK